jgi:hypothetical protein
MSFDENDFKIVYNDIVKCLNKKSNYTICDLEKYMKLKFGADKIELKDINKIMKKGYKLYHKNCDTPIQVSEDMILNEDYYATYIIFSNIMNIPTRKDSVYIHTAYMISSKDKKYAQSFCIFNGTKTITNSLEVLCNKTVDDIKKRYI